MSSQSIPLEGRRDKVSREYRAIVRAQYAEFMHSKDVVVTVDATAGGNVCGALVRTGSNHFVRLDGYGANATFAIVDGDLGKIL